MLDAANVACLLLLSCHCCQSQYTCVSDFIMQQMYRHSSRMHSTLHDHCYPRHTVSLQAIEDCLAAYIRFGVPI